MRIEQLDHLGIVAGIVDELGLVERVNSCLGVHEQQIVSPGQAIKAMILNGLGFVSAPLFLYEEFFEGKATSHLLGEQIGSEHLNDDCLGRALDKVWDYGGEELFSLIAMDAYKVFRLKTKCYHLDSSSISVYGKYESSAVDESAPEIVHGYSKDHRPDLKQFILETICANDGDVPLMLKVASGNQSDKAVFAERLKHFSQQWNVDGVMVADSALYSAENLETLGSTRWITRVPLSLAAAQQAVSQLPESAFEQSQSHRGYRLSSLCSSYAGVLQRWVVVESESRRQSDHKALDKRVNKEQKEAHRQLRRQANEDFNCADDARKQLEDLAAKWNYHTLIEIQVEQREHYAQPGRPKRGAIPTHISYRARAKLIEHEIAIATARRKAGRFILATNQLDQEQVSANEILSDYKGQQSCERGYRILKDPVFFCSSVFLKKPERIAALAVVMGLSLMVYTLAQRKLRQALTRANRDRSDFCVSDLQSTQIRRSPNGKKEASPQSSRSTARRADWRQPNP